MRWMTALVFLLAFTDPSLAQQGGCGLETRLTANTTARVTPGAPNRVRDGAGILNSEIGLLPGSSYFTALDDVACADGFTWRRVQYTQPTVEGGIVTGWTAVSNATDYFVEVSPFQGTPVVESELSFVVAADLPQDITYTVVPPDYDDDNPTQVDFPGYAIFELSEGSDEPIATLRVYRTDAYDDGFQRGADYPPNMFEGRFASAIDGLAQLQDELPDLQEFDVINNRLPDLAPGVAPGMYARRSYTDFQNGTGVQFITYYQQDFFSPGESVLYRFNGLTVDSTYLVVAEASVSAPGTPPQYDRQGGATSANPFEHYREYSEELAAHYVAIPPGQWSIDLTLLDAWVQSLVVSDVIALNS